MKPENNAVSIDVDIGGTFTDALINWEGTIVSAKTPTTGYNLSVGFIRAVEDAARQLDLDVQTLLSQTAIIRYSTTIAMNKLIERKGSPLGLITTRGFEDTIIVGKGAQWADGLSVRERRNVARAQRPEPIIPRSMTVGVRERIDSFGSIVCPLDEEDVREKIAILVDRGARGFVVSLLWSYSNPTHERKIRSIVRDMFPECFLGTLPVFLSSEVLPKRYEYTRTVTTMLNAYLHQAMWEELLGMSEELRNRGYNRSLMMVHNNGGMAEVFKTAAVQTYSGGPVAGLLGAAHLGRQLSIQDLIVADMGGTSFDMSLIEGGMPRAHLAEPLIDRWRVGIAMLETQSIGAGGGSIAWLNHTVGQKVEVGPHSASAIPGPAAYDMGGQEPTVTDADLVLGYLNPQYFHGGQLQLSSDMARRAIEKRISGPLGISVEEGAMMIRQIIDAKMGYNLFKETALKGYDARNLALIACGGAGPTHCCGFGEFAQVKKIITFPFSPVFCAFGSSNMDIRHSYEKSSRIQLLAPGGKDWLNDYHVFNSVVDELKERAFTDLRGGSFERADLVFELTLDMKFGGQLNSKRTQSPSLYLKGQDDVLLLYNRFCEEYSRAYSKISLFPAGGVEIHNFLLHVIICREKYDLHCYPLVGEIPSERSRKGNRQVYWRQNQGFCQTPLYEEKFIEPGNVIHGPAIIEAPHTTTVIPPGWLYRMNEFRAGILTRES